MPARTTCPPLLRILMVGGGVLPGSPSLQTLARAAVGYALPAADVREIAVVVVLPAIPLGIYLLLTRKGGGRRRVPGGIWMELMASTAIPALFVRQIDHGGFARTHILVSLTPVPAWMAVASARAGRIALHRRLVGMLLGALVIPGLFALTPGRVMASWAFG